MRSACQAMYRHTALFLNATQSLGSAAALLSLHSGGMELLSPKQLAMRNAEVPQLQYGAGMSAPGYAQVGGRHLYNEAANRIDPLRIAGCVRP